MVDEKVEEFLGKIERPEKIQIEMKTRDLQILLDKLGYNLAYDNVERLIVMKQVITKVRDILKKMYNELGWVLRDTCGYINKAPKIRGLLMRLPLRTAWGEIRQDLELEREETKIIADYINTQLLAVYNFVIDTLAEWLERGDVHETIGRFSEKLEEGRKERERKREN